MSPRLRALSLGFVVALALWTRLEAQSLTISYRFDSQQSGAGVVNETGAGVSLEATYKPEGMITNQVELDGLGIGMPSFALALDPKSTDPLRYSYSAAFANRDRLTAAVPPGTYSFDDGTQQWECKLPEFTILGSVSVVSYDALQHWDGGDLVVTFDKEGLGGLGIVVDPLDFGSWQPPAPLPNPLEWLNTLVSHYRLLVRRSDGTVVYSSDDPGNPPLNLENSSYTIRGLASAPGEHLSVEVMDELQFDRTGVRFVATRTFRFNVTREPAAVPTVAGPAITAQPQPKAVNVGDPVVLSVTASGDALTYQWMKDGVAIAAATSGTLTLPSARPADAGNYSVTVTNSAGSVTSQPATVTVDPVTRISNVSIRATSGGDAATLIMGFVVGGNGTSGSKPLLIRGIGPALASFGVADAAADPAIELYGGTTFLYRNDDWSGDGNVVATGRRVGAFALPSSSSKDAALVAICAISGYTARVPVAGGPGTVLAEVYDGTDADAFGTATPRLINVSARAPVGTGGNILIAGFSVTGTKSETILVRAAGPALQAYGVTGALMNPKVEVYRTGSTTPMASNDDWGTSDEAAITAAAANVGAFAFPKGSKDAALLVVLPPGGYTVQVSGVDGQTGVALAELYEVR